MSDDARRWHIATVPHARDSLATPEEVTWEQLASTLTTPHPHPGPPDEKATKERIAGWIPARLKLDANGEYRRKAENVVDVAALVLDLDNGEPLPRARELAKGWRAVFHTSWSCTPQHPKGRLVFPFAEPCPVVRWRDVWAAGSRWAATAGITVDPAVKDACRLYFLPAVTTEDARRASWFRAWVNTADSDCYLHWRWLLAAHPAPVRQEAPKPVPSTVARTFTPGKDATARDRYVAGILRRRADDLARGVQGGRNQACFRAGAVLGQLEAAGAVVADRHLHELVAAACASGLDAAEAEHALRNGIARGLRDGPFTFPT